jgi:hypothetical protein
MGLGKPSPDTSNYYDGLWDKSPGIASVGSYQAAGKPWVTGSAIGGIASGATVSFTLPNVSKSITLLPLQAMADFLVMHFVPTTAGPVGKVIANHSIPFPTAGAPAITLDVKCTEIYVTNILGGPSAGGFNIYASLTGIDDSQMFVLTGSGISE